jgi:hypothetical protein
MAVPMAGDGCLYQGPQYQEYRVSEERFGWFALMMACAAVGWVVMSCVDDTLPGMVKVGTIGAGLFGLVTLTISAWRASTMTGPDGVVVRGLLRTRTFAWSDIQDIRIELNPAAYLGHSGAPRNVVVLYDSTGRRVALPYVNEKNLYELGFTFATVVEAMRVAWRDHRGVDWAQLPGIQPKIDKYRRYDATSATVGMFAALLAAPAALVLFFVGLFTRAYRLPAPLSWLLGPESFLLLPAVVFVIATIASMLARRRARPR